MKLEWVFEVGPSTTQELADKIEKEGKLFTGNHVTKSFWQFRPQRCLWGVIGDFKIVDRRIKPKYILSDVSIHLLWKYNLSVLDNDRFKASPSKRCQEMVKRLRAIP